MTAVNAKYGEMSIYSVTLIVNNGIKPVDAWNQAGQRYYPDKKLSRNKSCPKGAFLGLCQSGEVNGVPSGQYIDEENENMDHVTQLLTYLRKHPKDMEIKSKSKIWKNAGFEIQHNNQVDIVLALQSAQLLDI